MQKPVTGLPAALKSERHERPLFARARGFEDHFELVKQIDIAGTHAKARKLAGDFDEARTWEMSRGWGVCYE
jgi:hypothetical protein